MSKYNVHSPCVVGNEFYVDNPWRLPITSDVIDSATLDDKIVSTVTENISAIAYYMDFQGSTQDSLNDEGNGVWEVEIWPYDDFGSGLTVAPFLPGQTANFDGYVIENGNAHYEYVDPYPYLQNMTPENPQEVLGQTYCNESWIQPKNGGQMFVGLKTADSMASLAGKQIISVRIKVAVDQIIMWGSDIAGAQVTPFLNPYVRSEGTPYSYQGRQGSQSTYKIISSEWLVNPDTGASWQIEDVQKFHTSGPSAYYFGAKISANGAIYRPPMIYAIWMEVTYRDPESRLARGVIRNLEPGWNTIAPIKDFDGNPWPKQADEDYYITLRRRQGNGSAAAIVLSSLGSNQAVVNQNTPVMGVLTNYSTRTRLPISIVNDDAGACGLVLIREDDLYSADSQVYAVADGEYVPALGLNNQWSMVNVARDIRQTLIIPDTDDYGLYSFLCRVPSEVTTHTLTMTLRSAVDDSILGGPVNVTPGQLNKKLPYGRFQKITGIFEQAPIALNEDDEVYFEFTAGGPNHPNVSWRVQVLSALDPSGPGGLGEPVGWLTYGGDEQCYQYRFGGDTEFTDVPWADICAKLTKIPDPMTGLAATPVWVDGDEGKPAINLSWDPSIVDESCPGFLAYAIVRSDDGGLTWNLIASITDPEVTVIQDQECLINFESQYRARVIRQDGMGGAWSDAVSATATSTRGGYCYSSNEAPDWIVWYEDLPPREYTFVNNTVAHQLADRDKQVVIRELEDRGDMMTIHALLSGFGGRGGVQTPPSPEGPRQFDPLRILSGAKRNPATGEKVTTSYVCVRDRHGSRWFAAINIGAGTRNAPRANMYTADVQVIEVTDIPSVFDAVAET